MDKYSALLFPSWEATADTLRVEPWDTGQHLDPPPRYIVWPDPLICGQPVMTERCPAGLGETTAGAFPAAPSSLPDPGRLLPIYTAFCEPPEFTKVIPIIQ